MNEILIAGLGIIGGLLAYLFFNFGKDEISQKHYLLRLLLLGCLFGVFILIGKVGLDSSESCKILVNSTTEVAGSFEFTYDEFCFENNSNNTHIVFYKLTLWIIRLITAYILVYLIYEVFVYFNKIAKGKYGRSKE